MNLQFFTVDDGTGAISCVCWKPEPISKNIELPMPLKEKCQQLDKLQESLHVGFDVGDLLNVRGKIKTYHGNRELMCSFHGRVFF